jgi:hypothetical protein
MKLAHALTRRSFLQLFLSLAALSWLQPFRVLRRVSAWNRPDPLTPRLTALFAHPGSAAIVGQAYLRTASAETDERRLVALVCEALPGGRAGAALSTTRQLHDHVRDAQRRDFAQGRVVRVDGWILARTEARLCALAALRS